MWGRLSPWLRVQAPLRHPRQWCDRVPQLATEEQRVAKEDSTKMNQTARLSYVGIVSNDGAGSKPSYLIKACFFKQLWTNGQP